ncbi:PAS domain-containing sensor histidine kinase [Romboutsia sp. 1001216sp1]|uniref:sensor histidine kinase n=1 Tax=Romboutsia sp. 1001216sp1 TaxID=2986997 RepID=UPI00232AD639|nr:PAS domain-containing sensor histidine kinase [Romboutsia sp. 1001216sp1]MDB8790914.1 PAS domain-containing sensor histidine kinase [Romboutsia sp. 1001216sp1]
MKEFFNNLSDSIFILDKDFNIIFCNNKLLEYINEKDINSLNIDISSKVKIEKLEFKNYFDIGIKLNTSNGEFELSTNITKTKDNGTYILVRDITDNNIDNMVINIDNNRKREFKNSEKLIYDMSAILDEIKKDSDIYKILENIDLEGTIINFIDEIKKVEFIKKDLEVFLSISADVIGAIDRNAYIKLFTKECNKITGFNEEELTSTSIIDKIYDDHKEEFLNILSLKDGNVKVIENKMICKDNSYKWLRWHLKYIKERDIIAFSVRDIDKEKEDVEARQKLEQNIYLESMKNEFFANISHEFKTPLNIMLGIIQLIDINIVKENIKFNDKIDLENYIKLFKQNLYRILRLVNNIIDITKIDAGYYELELGNYNIVNVVEEISLSVTPYAKNKQIDLVFDTDCEEMILAFDPEKIERILLNLLSNSIKHTSINGCIYVNVESKGDRVYISVCDNGEGIDSNKLQSIFERFTQVKSNIASSYEGSGIGLSLVKSLVNLHGGDISVKSEVGKGSKFEFYLPSKLVKSKTNIKKFISENSKIEMCNIEFSDIYR